MPAPSWRALTTIDGKCSFNPGSLATTLLITYIRTVINTGTRPMTRSTLSEISTSRLVAIMDLIDGAHTSDIQLITAAVVIRAELARRTNNRFAA
jgi:hypothetical protein